jgi:hypothetical protein
MKLHFALLVSCVMAAGCATSVDDVGAEGTVDGGADSSSVVDSSTEPDTTSGIDTGSTTDDTGSTTDDTGTFDDDTGTLDDSGEFPDFGGTDDGGAVDDGGSDGGGGSGTTCSADTDCAAGECCSLSSGVCQTDTGSGFCF